MIRLFFLLIFLSQFCYGKYEFVAEFEGFSRNRYWDATRWSIGYGTDAKGRMTISQSKALEEFEKEIEKREKEVIKKLKENGTPFNDTMLQAIVSFEYNLGYQERMWDRLKAQNFIEYANAMLRYTKSDGKVLNGLIKRRKKEKELFLQGLEILFPTLSN